MTDQELKDLAAENTKAMIEIRESIRELRESQKQTDIQIQELRESQKQTDEQMKKTDEQMKKTDERIDRLGQRFGDFGNNRGEEVEDFFYRYFLKNRNIRNVKFDDVERNIITADGQEHDIILINGESSALISIKYKIHKKDVDSLLKDELTRMRYFLTKVGSKHKIYAGIAGYVVKDDIEKYAESKGIYVFTRSGDNTILLNSEGFVGKEF